MTENRIGKFRLPMQLVREHWRIIAEAFAMIECVPVRAEALFAEDCIEYTAFSSRFAETMPGMVPMSYALRIVVERGHVTLVELAEDIWISEIEVRD